MNLRLLRLYLRRDLFSQWEFSFLTIVSIALGVGSVMGIHSYKENLSSAIRTEAKQLMGADIAVQSPHAPTVDSVRALDSVLPDGTKTANAVQFLSMVQSDKGETSLSFVKGIEKEYPFYGSFVTEPSDALQKITKNDILIDRNLGKNLKLQIGEKLSLGEKRFQLIGWIDKEPGSVGSFLGTAPTSLVLPEGLDNTGLLQRGSRVRYTTYLKFNDGINSKEWKEKNFETLIKEDLTIYHNTEVNSGSQTFLTNTFDYMVILALSGFFLGAISIFTAIRARLEEKKNENAILKCLGIEPTTYLIIVMSEIFILSCIGTALGFGLALQIQIWLPDLLGSEFLGKLPIGISATSTLWGMILGILIPLGISVYPLLQTVQVKPLHALKEIESRDLPPLEKLFLAFAFFLIYLLFFGIAYFETESWVKALVFSVILVSLPVLVYVLYLGLGIVLQKLLALGFVSKEWSLLLKKITRKSGNLRLAVLGLGSSLFILCLALVLQESLLELSGAREKERRPNMFLMDIRKDQLSGIDPYMDQYSAKRVLYAPIIGARLSRVNGERIKKEDTLPNVQDRSWKATARTREYFLSYRDSLFDTEKVTSGRWWDTNAKNEISVERDFAGYLKAGIGDTLTFNVQGVEIEGTITNLRSVNWSDMKPNFVVIFSKGDLERAPGFYMASLLIEEGETRYQFQKALVKQYPNLTIIDTEKAVQAFTGILAKVTEMMQLMTGFIFASGILLVFTTLYSNQKERKTEIKLLRVIGADGKFLIAYYSKEAILLCLFSFGMGLIYSLVANFTLNEVVLELKAIYPYQKFGMALIVSLALTWFAYALGLYRLLQKPVKTL